jgi:molybdopterin synthase catalytic subunit
MSSRFAISATPLDDRAPLAALEAEGAGGIVVFVGRVRARSRGREVLRLEYEAYAEMAERVFAQIGAEAGAKFELTDIAIHHRTGVLEPGEVSVVIVTAAGHRAAAFDACRWAIDRLKQIAPIWKKEHFADGAVWVDERP